MNRDWRNVSAVLIVLTTVALVVYDLVPFASAPDHDTLSEVMRDAGAPAAFLGAFLVGHFWIQWIPRQLPHWIALSLGALIALLVTAIAQVLPPFAGSPFAVAAGLLAGAVLWPLDRRAP